MIIDISSSELTDLIRDNVRNAIAANNQELLEKMAKELILQIKTLMTVVNEIDPYLMGVL